MRILKDINWSRSSSIYFMYQLMKKCGESIVMNMGFWIHGRPTAFGKYSWGYFLVY